MALEKVPVQVSFFFFFRFIYLFYAYEYTVAIFRYTRREHWILLQMVLSQLVGIELRTS